MGCKICFNTIVFVVFLSRWAAIYFCMIVYVKIFNFVKLWFCIVLRCYLCGFYSLIMVVLNLSDFGVLI